MSVLLKILVVLEFSLSLVKNLPYYLNFSLNFISILLPLGLVGLGDRMGGPPAITLANLITLTPLFRKGSVHAFPPSAPSPLSPSVMVFRLPFGLTLG
jgi:hypothetical protein